MKCPPCNQDCNQGRTCPNRQIKQEPVAWMYKMEDGSAIVSVRMMFNKDAVSEIPLYTAPRELSNKEIIKTMVQFDVYSADDQCLIEAGRAIIKKASEK